MTPWQPWKPIQRLLQQWGGAIAFYTCIPIPHTWPLDFNRIARWAPIIGLLIGGILGLSDFLLQLMNLPLLTRSALIVSLWIAITGGLHLDGAMDTADGLAVLDPQRRLAVMADSRSGAFGVMAAIALFGLKTAALSDLTTHRTLALMAVAGWGRWGQLWAIAQYPYLKPTGKGAFHKAQIKLPWDVFPGSIVLLGLSGSTALLQPPQELLGIVIIMSGSAIAISTAAWFNHQLKGHTGDTYGAIVEWTEALMLCCLTLI